MEPASGNRFLLTCAMTRYQHCAEWDREELREDVTRMVGLFCGDFLPEAGRYTHADVLGDSPTSVELKDRLRDFFTSADRRPDDYVIIYFTGHGEILENGDFVLLTSDTRPSDLINRTVPPAEIVRMALANTQTRRLLLLLDTCYSGQGGDDMTLEALRHIGEPGKRVHDQEATSEGSSVVIVAATRPFELALPGTFTAALDRAARSPATAGSAVPTLRIGALIGAMKADEERPRSQSSVWHQVGMNTDEPSFIMNPRYRRELVDADLLEQERAQYTERRADHLRRRFVPAARWFTGRHEALTNIARWLDDPADLRPLVVTGGPGSGKTALLGLLAALSDPEESPGIPRDALPADLTIPRGAITENIYAGTMTTDQVRDQIAAAADEHAGSTAELVDVLTRHRCPAMTVLIDALDEAADPSDLVGRLLGTLVQKHRGALRLLLGTRPDLLTDRFLGEPEAGHYLLINLDSPQYADTASMRTYIRRILLSEDSLDSAYKPSGLYRTATADTLDAVVDAIGAAAGTSFLVARITAATEATMTRLPDGHDVAWRRALPRRAGPAMRRDLRVRLGEDADKAARLLLPLAYAQGSGLPWEDIWPALADALSPGHRYGSDDLKWLRRTAGSYAAEGVADKRSAYRLYHQALTDYLLEGRDQQADQQVITSTLIRLVLPGRGGAPDWRSAHPYTRAHLATHAAQAGRIDDLLTDPAYLLAADRPQLLAATAYARSRPARAAADAYRRAARHLRPVKARQHASYLQLAARCGRAPQLGDALEDCRPRDTWSCTWASWRLEPPHRALTGHDGPVYAVTTTTLNGHPLVISGSGDGSLRKWDLATGAPAGRSLTGHAGPVYAVTTTTLEGRPVVVSGSGDGSVRVWDLATGKPARDPLTGHDGPVRAVTTTTLNGRPLVISGSDDSTIRVWDLATGKPARDPLTGHDGPVRAVTTATLEGRPVVVSGSGDGSVRVWDLATGKPIRDPLTGHDRRVYAVTTATQDDRPVVISGSDDWTIRVRDLATGKPVRDPIAGHADWIGAVTTVTLDDRHMVISGSGDGSVRAWDLATGAPVGDPLTGHDGPVRAVSTATLDDRPVVISGSEDGSVRVWDLAASRPVRDPFTGHTAPVRAVTTATLDDRHIVISGGDDRTVRIWDLATGDPVRDPLTGHDGPVYGVTTATLNGRPVVISGADDGSIRVWDLATSSPVGDPLTGHDGPVYAVTTATLNGRPVVISGSGDSSIRAWDLATSSPVGDPLTGHDGPVFAVTTATLNGRPVVISGSGDSTVRIWDLAAGTVIGDPFTGHTGPVYAVTTATLNGRPVVISGSGDGSARAWDLAAGTVIGDPFTGHAGWVYAVTTATLDGRPIVISGADDGSLRVWDLATGAPAGHPFTGHVGVVYGLITGTLDGRPVVICGKGDRTIRVWDLASGALVGDPFTGHAGWVYAVTTAAMGGRPVVISGADDGSVRVWDLATGGPVRDPLTGHAGWVYAVTTATLDGLPVVISGGDDRTVRVWNLATGSVVGRPFGGHLGAVNAVAASTLDGRPVVVAGADGGSVWVWELATGAPVGDPLTGHDGAVNSVAAATLDGRPVAVSGGDDRTVRVWDLARQRAMRHRFRRVRLHHAASVLAAVLVRRENRLDVITGCRDNFSRAWDLAACRALSRTEIPGSSGVSAIAALADDHVVYATDRTIYLFSADNPDTHKAAIELDSEILALAAHGSSTVVAATRLGLLTLDIPH